MRHGDIRGKGNTLSEPREMGRSSEPAASHTGFRASPDDGPHILCSDEAPSCVLPVNTDGLIIERRQAARRPLVCTAYQ